MFYSAPSSFITFFFKYLALKLINIVKQSIRINIRQDTGYSTSSSRTSSKNNKIQKDDKRRVLMRHREVDSEEFYDLDDEVEAKRKQRDKNKGKRLKKDDFKNEKEKNKSVKKKSKVCNLTSEECEDKSAYKSQSESDIESDHR